MANPQKEDGYTPIANETLEALAATKLNTQESRVLFAILRKTYGFRKKEDWIANSELERITGIHRCHCANTVTRLKRRNIVTKTGNKIQFNKDYSQWRVLPKQVTPKRVVPKQVTSSTQTGNLLVPKQVHTKETITKENIQKKESTPKEQMETFLNSVEEKNSYYEDLLGLLVAKGMNKESAGAELENFVGYWTERNKGGTKQRWQMQKTFEVKRRLTTWLNNCNKFSKKSQWFEQPRSVSI